MGKHIQVTKPSDKCPLKMCDGSGQIKYKDEKEPMYQSLANCHCHYIPFVNRQWERTVGAHDQWVRLKDLKPSTKSKLPPDVQEKCIKLMKDDPLGSYVMLGQSGVSKTTFAIGLYHYALNAEPWNYTNIIRIKAKNLLDIIQSWRYDEYFRRENHIFTTAKQITAQASRGNITRLFLEELEKVKYTEHKSTEIFDIIDALYETGGQLVLTGNLTFADLNDTSKFPEGLLRRVDEICAKHKWDFWKYATQEAK